jgi:acyl dehydratase
MTHYTLEVGQILRLARPEVLSESKIVAFAAAGADSSPTHLSNAAAREVHLPRALAHGMLGMALMARLLLDHFPQSALKSLQARFVAMTFHEDHLTCTARVDRIVSEEHSAYLALLAVNQNGNVVLTGSASVSLVPACG